MQLAMQLSMQVSMQVNMQVAMQASLHRALDLSLNILMRDVAKRYNHSLTLSGKWQASSFKGGHGVDSLLSPDTDLYWQSDGPQPHSLSVQFTKKMTIQVSRIINFRKCQCI
jgi:hypothetical protein